MGFMFKGFRPREHTSCELYHDYMLTLIVRIGKNCMRHTVSLQSQIGRLYRLRNEDS